MKKTLLIIGAAFSLLSCGNDTQTTTTDTPSTSTNSASKSNNSSTKVSKSENMTLGNTQSLQAAEDALKALPQYAGKELNVFQNVNFYDDGRIKIAIQDPNKPANIDEYTFQNGQWSEPSPLQISGDGDMASNTTPLSKIKFSTVATIYNNWMEKAKEVEGAMERPLTHIYYSLFVPMQKREWRTSDIDGTREKHSITFNDDGSIKEFKKK